MDSPFFCLFSFYIVARVKIYVNNALSLAETFVKNEQSFFDMSLIYTSLLVNPSNAVHKKIII